jgi:hypothetical protein
MLTTARNKPCTVDPTGLMNVTKQITRRYFKIPTRIGWELRFLGHYARSRSNLLETLRDNLSVPSSGFKNPIVFDSLTLRMGLVGSRETSVRNYYSSLRSSQINCPCHHTYSVCPSAISASLLTRKSLAAAVHDDRNDMRIIAEESSIIKRIVSTQQLSFRTQQKHQLALGKVQISENSELPVHTNTHTYTSTRARNTRLYLGFGV